MYGLEFRLYGFMHSGFMVSQTPARIYKVDPLIWGPILLRVLYRNPH